MTNVLFNDKEQRIVCVDHADKREICAAISAVMYSLYGWVNNYASDSTCVMEPGFSLIEYVGDKEPYIMAKIGLLQIQLAYPESIKVQGGEEFESNI